MWQKKNANWFIPFIAYGIPTFLGIFLYKNWSLGLMVFGFLRWVITLHSTWTVNSLAHGLPCSCGHTKYNDKSSAEDSIFVSLITHGEGHHNYHHKYPMDYATGEKEAFPFGLQWNPSKILIDFLALLGQVYDRKRYNHLVNKIK